VRAGLVSDPADWEWSSYRASALLVAPLTGCDVAWIRNVTGDGSPEPYRKWVMAGLDDACDYLHPARKVPGPRTGQATKAAQTRSPEKGTWEPPVAPINRPLDEILAGCVWRSRDSADNDLLRLRLHEAVDAGYSQREIAGALGTTHVTIGKLLHS
jgi:hypothetical protein